MTSSRLALHLLRPRGRAGLVLCGDGPEPGTADLASVTCDRCLRLAAALVVLGVEFRNSSLDGKLL